MLSVDRINKLEYYNDKMINVLITVQDILVEGVSNDMPYEAIYRVLEMLYWLDEEMSNDYKKVPSM